MSLRSQSQRRAEEASNLKRFGSSESEVPTFKVLKASTPPGRSAAGASRRYCHACTFLRLYSVDSQLDIEDCGHLPSCC